MTKGILKKAKDDYGQAIGMITNGLSEEKEVADKEKEELVEESKQDNNYCVLDIKADELIGMGWTTADKAHDECEKRNNDLGTRSYEVVSKKEYQNGFYNK